MIVLDTSALLAMLLGEPGGDSVAAVLPGAVMTTVNLAEVVGYFARNGVKVTEIRRYLSPLGISYTDLDADLAYEIGILLPLTRSAGLSLGDRACLALARRLDAEILTADRQWATVAAAAGVVASMIR